ncbi:MAG: hypothetical protein PHO15_10525 [Eubacteriales bacterium]|nr:hypothetical protein [Eubacteriales bacterium]
MEDRFWGEATPPPVWAYCEYCGGAIYSGGEYWRHGDLKICDGCACRYAWALFEERAMRRTAQRESVT